MKSAEQALTAHVASVLSGTVDTNVFRGEIPSGRVDCAAVHFQNIPGDNRMEMDYLIARVIEKYERRNNA